MVGILLLFMGLFGQTSSASLVAPKEMHVAPSSTISLPSASAVSQDGADLVLHPHKSPLLTRGDLLVQSPSLSRIRIAQMEITSLHGVYSMQLSSETITVVALTSPVSIQSGNEYVLVPQGMQWKGDIAEVWEPLESEMAWAERKPDIVPKHYLQRLQKRARTHFTPLDSTSVALEDSIDVQLLSSIHPLYRNAAWMQAHTLPSSLQVLRVLTLPLSQGGAESLHNSVLRQWKHAVHVLLKDGENILPVLHDIVALSTTRSLQQGLPQRAEALTHVFNDIAHVHGWNPPDPVVALVSHELHTQEEAHAYTTDSIPAELERIAREDLRQSGALFTVNTNISAIAPHRVRVYGIMYPTNNGDDVLLDFVYDTDKKRARDIVVRGTLYPLATPLSGIASWVQKGSI